MQMSFVRERDTYYLKVLLEPFEEQFNLSAVTVKFRSGTGYSLELLYTTNLMIESDIMFFASLRFHVICLNCRVLLARTTNVPSIKSIL